MTSGDQRWEKGTGQKSEEEGEGLGGRRGREAGKQQEEEGREGEGRREGGGVEKQSFSL